MRWANVPLHSSVKLARSSSTTIMVPLCGSSVALSRIDRTKRELEISAATNRLIVSGVLVAFLQPGHSHR
jgi:hypothetical protein